MTRAHGRPGSLVWRAGMMIMRLGRDDMRSNPMNTAAESPEQSTGLAPFQTDAEARWIRMFPTKVPCSIILSTGEQNLI
jgi:hypothetical protein